MSTPLESKEAEFALKICRALDEQTTQIDPAAADRLAVARRTALARKKPEKVATAAPVMTPALAGAGGMNILPGDESRGSGGRFSRFGRFALAWPLLALVVGLAGIAYWEDQQRTAELADIDAAMLSDNLPLDAYLDHGFNAYLTRNH